jgi:diguanylate cyclase (GGDEF)-like protein
MDLDSDLLLWILFVGILANTALIVGLAVTGRLGGHRQPVPSAARQTAIEQTLARSYVDVTARSAWPEPTHAAAATVVDADADDAEAATGPAVSDGTDPLTGLRDAASFARLVALEEPRVVRYHRPATIVVLELDGLDRLVDRLGPGAGDRVVPALADTIQRQARGADVVARLGTGRFGVLLPETDEVAAINYVERVRKASELWLESGAMALRLAIGWAGTNGDTSLTDAHRVAVERMFGELRRAARREGVDAVGASGYGAVVGGPPVEVPAVEVVAEPPDEPTRIAS